MSASAPKSNCERNRDYRERKKQKQALFGASTATPPAQAAKSSSTTEDFYNKNLFVLKNALARGSLDEFLTVLGSSLEDHYDDLRQFISLKTIAIEDELMKGNDIYCEHLLHCSQDEIQHINSYKSFCDTGAGEATPETNDLHFKPTSTYSRSKSEIEEKIARNRIENDMLEHFLQLRETREERTILRAIAEKYKHVERKRLYSDI